MIWFVLTLVGAMMIGAAGVLMVQDPAAYSLRQQVGVVGLLLLGCAAVLVGLLALITGSLL